jgi:hypothetical protein
MENVPLSEEQLFYEVSFAFTDQRVANMGFAFQVKPVEELGYKPPIEVDQAYLDLNPAPQNDNTRGLIRVSLFGPSDLLTRHVGLEQSTLIMMSLLEYGNLPDVYFSGVSLRLGVLGVDTFISAPPENISQEAQIVEARLRPQATAAPHQSC